MSGEVFLVVVLAGSWLTWFVRDRHLKGWRRPLFRRRGYDVAAAGRGDATKGYQGLHVPSGGGSGDPGGF